MKMNNYLQLAFYASKPGTYNNKLFKFWLDDLEGGFRVINRFFENGNNFRSVFLNAYVNRPGTQKQQEFSKQLTREEIKKLNVEGPTAVFDFFT